MPNNKNKKSAFYFFAKDYAERNSCSIKDAIVESYPEWKALTPHEMEPYETQLVRWKEQQNYEKNSIKDLSGQDKNPPVIRLEDLYHGSESVLTKERKDALDEFRAKTKVLDLKKQKWYFIKFQTYCKTEDLREENCVYVLAEVGLVEYSLQSGVTREYHQFIRPESVPYGYRSVCMDKIKLYHQIPLDFERASADYSDIYLNIMKLVRPCEENNYYAPIFCINEDFNEVRYGLRWLYGKCDAKNKTRLDSKLIDLQTLVATLGTEPKKMVQMSFNVANEILTSFNFDYTIGNRCEYHEDLGIIHCALGFVRRYSYLISDQICPIHDIEPIAGKHLPIEKFTFTATKLVASDDFRTTAKLLRNSYKESTSQLSRGSQMGSRNGMNNNNSNSYGRNTPDYAASHTSGRRNKVAERFSQSQFDDTASITESFSAISVTTTHTQKQSNCDKSDKLTTSAFDGTFEENFEEEEEDEEENSGDEQEWVEIQKKSSNLNYGRVCDSGRRY